MPSCLDSECGYAYRPVWLKRTGWCLSWSAVAPAIKMRLQFVRKLFPEGFIQWVVGHLLCNGIKEGLALPSVFRLLQWIPFWLFGHPELVESKPSGIRSDDVRRDSIQPTHHLINWSSLQQPFLLRHGDGGQPDGSRQTRLPGRSDKELNFVGVSVPGLEGALSIDCVGAVDGLE